MSARLIGGRYTLLELIGEGGEARVYKARDEETSQLIALRLARDVSMTFAEHGPFQPSHPNWVRLLDAGTDPVDGCFQALELLEGPTLTEKVTAAPLDRAAWANLVQRSLAALNALHETGRVHGDLHAENFLLNAANQQWKILELPFLRFSATPGRTALFGSIHTLAPEQLNGAVATTASDIYALGCLYYYASCGKYPQTGTAQEIAIDRLRFPADPLAENTSHLSAEEIAWVMTLLERRPQDRPSSLKAAHQLLKLHN